MQLCYSCYGMKHHSTSRPAVPRTATIPVLLLAEILGSCPEDLEPVLTLCQAIGAVRLLADGRVELPAHAAAGLGLDQDEDGRWSLRPAGWDSTRVHVRVADGVETAHVRSRVLPLFYPDGLPDRRGSEPWETAASAEESPPCRIASLVAWLDRQDARAVRAGRPGDRPDA